MFLEEKFRYLWVNHKIKLSHLLKYGSLLFNPAHLRIPVVKSGV